MKLPQQVNSAIVGKYRFPLLLVLIAAGLAGNYCNFPIFLNIDFLFGSIFALLVLQLFGLSRGVLAAAIISSYTYILWNHPYAIIIMTAEVVIVGWLTGRHKIGMVLADTLYWLFIGMPLVYFFYHLVMHVPVSETPVFMTKQAVNGIANALFARLIFTAFALKSRSLLTSYSELVYNMLAFFVLCPTLVILAVDSRSDFKVTDRQIRTTLMQDSRRVTDRVAIWVVNRKSAITYLAEIAASKTPQQMQPYLEQAKKSDINFNRVGVMDKGAITTAYFPLFDELGQSNIGKSFADRSYIPILKRTLKPMLSEVALSKMGVLKPRVGMFAPVVVRGEFGGYITVNLSLDQIREHLEKSTSIYTTLYTLLDKNGNIIMTNRTDQKVMMPFVRAKGAFNRLDGEISQWVPVAAPNTPYFERWKNSLYVVESRIGDLAEWKLILEQPVAPFHEILYKNYANKLTMLFLILLLSLLLAHFLSRMIAAALGQLRSLTHELPARLAVDGKNIVWPESGIKETNHLINNFREMSNTLTAKFDEIRQINESLEQRVAERTVELQDREALYHSLVETSQDLIWRCDTEGKFIYLNLAVEQVFGYELNEMLGKKFSDFKPAENVDHGLAMFKQLMEGNSIDSYESTFIGKSGNEIHLAIKAGFVSDEHDNIIGASGTAYDITERRQMEVKLREAKAAAEVANVAKSQFLATMSHEIRTPMNAVIGMVQLLQHTELTPEQLEYTEIAKNSGFELVHLLNDILDLSKIEADKIELEISCFDLRSMISDTINLLSLQAGKKAVELSATVDMAVPTALKGDAGRLRQIITNLVGNAIKFTASGAVSLQITQDTEDENSTTLRFLVRDNGIGIASDKLEHIFESFTQADSSTTRKFGGTGLGLAISKRLTELMAGRIGVESIENEGSTFWFTVVVEKQKLNDQQQIPLNTPLKMGEASTLIRILLVEDDPTAQKMVPRILKSYGYLVDVAADGKEALLALEVNDYLLVLMDCMMPEMSGYQVTAAIRDPSSKVRWHDIPIIALTGNAMKQDRDECIAAGMDDHLPKPLLLPDMLAMMEKWLREVNRRAHSVPGGEGTS